MRTFLKVSFGLIAILAMSIYGVYYWLTLPPVQAENPIINGVHYVGVTVSDLDKTQALYHEAANLTSVKQETYIDHPVINHLTNRTNSQVKTSLMASANAQLRFMEFGHPSEQAQRTSFVDANGPGIAHVCFQVNQSTNAYQKFLAAGASHIGAPEMVQVNEKNPVYYAYARDHDNIMVEIEHVDVEALKLPSPPKNDYRIRHISLATANMERAVDFYSTLLETQNPRRAGRLIKLKGDKVDQISGFKASELEMAWFQVRNLELELIQYYNPAPKALAESQVKHRPFDALGYNMIVFDVTNMALAKEKLFEAGGEIVSETQPMDGGQILLARDLDGNLLGFQTFENGVKEKASLLSARNFKDNGI